MSLFSLSDVNAQYGYSCGFGGIPLPLREEVDSLIEHKKQWQLAQWLYSEDITKSVYAAEGLIRLQNDGIELTNTQIRKIKELKNSEAKVMTCNGCLIGEDSIKNVLSKFLLKE